jgi:organic radical activating enzyme
MKIKVDRNANYLSIFDGKTILRYYLDETKPMLSPHMPEYLDICCTQKCLGSCQICYQDSTPNREHYLDAAEKIRFLFEPMSQNDRPYQFALGGGEPTSHPDFENILKTSVDLGIVPNYTTNGMWVKEPYRKDILRMTKQYCGGVAVSCHPHLRTYWEEATKLYRDSGTQLNLHVIISDDASVDYFIDICNNWLDKVDYIVLLKQANQGRAQGQEYISG